MGEGNRQGQGAAGEARGEHQVIFDQPLPPLETPAHVPMPLWVLCLVAVGIIVLTWRMAKR
jgi:hypothetical protein